jgi:hypothetical protein
MGFGFIGLIHAQGETGNCLSIMDSVFSQVQGTDNKTRAM